MQGTKVASRYAKSILNLSLEKGLLEQVYADMKLIFNTAKESKDLNLLLKSPIVKSDKKEKILSALFENKVNPLSMQFIKILTSKKREQYLYEVSEAFIYQYKQHKKILTAVITTAYGLDEDLKNKVIEVVKQSKQSEVELITKVDQSIVGGFILRVGDNQDDTSISRKIKQLRKTFNENPYIKEY